MTTAQPSAALVDAYLGEIAKGYGIAWSPPGADDDAGEGGVKVRFIAANCYFRDDQPI